MIEKIIAIGSKVIAVVAPVIVALKVFYDSNKEKMALIALEIEKANKDGKFTNEEKEEIFVLAFMQLFYPKIPKSVRIILTKKRAEKLSKFIIRKFLGNKKKSDIKNVIGILSVNKGRGVRG